MGIRRLAKRILPRAVVAHLRVARTLPLRRWPEYLRVWTLLPLRSDSPIRLRGIRSVLVVCRGNVIRSPIGATILKQILATTPTADFTVVSAGLHPSVGHPADPRARRVGAEFGLSLEEHSARPVTEDLIAQADLVVAMDPFVAAELLAQYPGAWSKTIMPEDIADPSERDEAAVRQCFEQIRAAMQGIASALVQELGEAYSDGSRIRRENLTSRGGKQTSCV